MDRCALFVDAGYVLADGAMAVHGTRRAESVSWDYEGLLQLLSSLARERSGLPLLRCYWYEAAVDGRRTAEQDALADVPGIKLRVAKIRPGRREGVETEIHRDLSTLARNNAISDALVISAEEDLAQVLADVQDMGMRVTLVHIAVDGNWTISRALRQEADDIIEISGEHLRPYVELVAGAEPGRQDEPEGADHAARALANGHGVAAPAACQPAPQVPGNHAPPSIYTAPVVAEYQRPTPQLPRPAGREPHDDRGRDERARDERASQDRDRAIAANGEAPGRADRSGLPSRAESPARPDPYLAPPSGTLGRQERAEPAPSPGARGRGAEDALGYPPAAAEAAPGAGPQYPDYPESAQVRRLPTARNPAGPGPLSPMGGPAPLPSAQPASPDGPSGPARGAPYGGPQPVPPPGGYPVSGGVSLSEAVQAAHEEGQEFGGSVARDAPALWLEAVLARKPRMPSDLEARLLQGSTLPIDFLLHDEVRHALRRGFWDALERTRR